MIAEKGLENCHIRQNELVVQRNYKTGLPNCWKKISLKEEQLWKKKTVKKMLSAALVGAMVLSLAACGSKGDSKDEGGDSKDGVTLEFQQWWGVELPDGALDDICKDFTKDTGINIKLLSNPYADTKTQIAAGAAAGTMADVVGLDGSWVYDFAKQGSIAN